MTKRYNELLSEDSPAFLLLKPTSFECELNEKSILNMLNTYFR